MSTLEPVAGSAWGETFCAVCGAPAALVRDRRTGAVSCRLCAAGVDYAVTVGEDELLTQLAGIERRARELEAGPDADLAKWHRRFAQQLLREWQAAERARTGERP